MHIRRAVVIVVAGIITASCSKKPAPDREKQTESKRETESVVAKEKDDERQPHEGEIAEDCVIFLRSTKIVSAQALTTDCPTCPAGGTEVLAFRQMKIERISCAGDSCNAVVTIRAVFNPGSGDRIAGGLAGWISPEQRSEYLSGRTPAGEQLFRVQIAYQRQGEGWRAVDFDRAPGE